MDENGVNAVTQMPEVHFGSLSVGASNTRLNHDRYNDPTLGISNWTHNYNITLVPGQDDNGNNIITINLGNTSVIFNSVSGAWQSHDGDGSSLTGGSQGYNYTDHDGIIYNFQPVYPTRPIPAGATAYTNGPPFVAGSIAYPEGEVLSFTYLMDYYSQQVGYYNYAFYNERLTSVRSSLGYQLNFGYLSNTLAYQSYDWFYINRVQATNLAKDSCVATASACSVANQPSRIVQYSSQSNSSGYVNSFTNENGDTQNIITTQNYGSVTLYNPNAGGYVNTGNEPITTSSVYNIGSSVPAISYSFGC